MICGLQQSHMLLRVKNEGSRGLRGGHDLLCSPSIIFTEGVLESDSEAEEGLSPLHPLSILRYEQTRYPLVW